MGTKAWVGSGLELPSCIAIIPTTRLYWVIGIITISSFTSVQVPVGRDAIFTCIVNHLGGYRVGWIKLDTKAIQAIGNTVITHNPRVSVTHSGQSIWNLHISNVQPDDAGPYGCQINTNPMKSLAGALEVTVPPDIVDELTPSDVTVKEESNVKLACRAKGIPVPKIVWRREDGSELHIKEDLRRESNLSSGAPTTAWDGEVLRLPRVLRQHSGPYLCIASNGVPPPVSKRVMVNVQFAPSINVLNQLIGAPVGSDVVLECTIEASPRPISFWTKDKDMVVQSNRFLVDEVRELPYRFKLTLTIKYFRASDAGRYHCQAKNSLGDAEGTVRIYEIILPQKVRLGTDDGDDENAKEDDNPQSIAPATTFQPSTTILWSNQTSIQHGNHNPIKKQTEWDNDSTRRRPKFHSTQSSVSRQSTSDGLLYMVVLSYLCKLME